jgi:SAM-dependent methyltransferase
VTSLWPKVTRGHTLKLHLGCFDQPIPGWINTDITPHILVARIPRLPFLLYKAGLLTDERYQQHRNNIFQNVFYLNATAQFPFEKSTFDYVFRGSITSLPVASDSFDVVYLRLILHHLVYPKYALEDGLRECFRVLKPGGMLALVEPNSWHPVGALMNLAHALGLDMYIHGTDDDVALSPRALRKMLSNSASDVSTHVVTYSWRRLPIPIQEVCYRFQHVVGKFSTKVPYFGHTLMMTAVKANSTSAAHLHASRCTSHKIAAAF